MMPKIVSSPSNPIIKDIKSLEMRKRRKETGLFIAEGLRSVREGVELGFVLKYVVFHESLRDKDEILDVLVSCDRSGGLSLVVSREVLEKISRKDNPQSVIGVFVQQSLSLDDRALSTGLKSIPSRLIVLEQVRDPGNLGTIIRTVDAVGASGVILIDSCCDAYSIECVRASMGSIFAVPIYQASMEEFDVWIKSWRQKYGGKVIATALQGAKDFRLIDQDIASFLLMMGNEQAGLSERLRAHADYIIKLPMNGRADSLNLSVATGVCLYALVEPWG